MESTTNELFSLAADIIGNTSQSVFLTGKAGTGKTTFLHHIRNTVNKNIIVAAPTGVAAINAGGVTLHSLLQLPFDPFVPTVEGRQKLDYHFRLRKSKIEMLQELELLIIDEVSMLRADMLDAIDHLLRRYRGNKMLFGGVQMLFIGDLFQLPPVVQNHEWVQLRPYYASPFFFHAQALNGNMPLYIELKTVYRQSDQQFIEVLNRIRNNETNKADLELLNARYNPHFAPSAEDKYVTLCTHNYKADQINKTELQKLTTKPFSFQGKVNGDFAENSYPTDISLTIKEGMQVMFVKNDVGEQRRYYNGKLATVCQVATDKITVRFEDDSEMELEQDTWRNVRYALNEDSGEIEEEELGYFKQYPIRSAWAITIHKSQGLTFEKVIIDAGQAFAAGQVYVALSRCTTLDGIILYSKITENSIQTDSEALAFARQEQNTDYLKKILTQEKEAYIALRLKRAFDWSYLLTTIRSFYELVSGKNIPNKEQTQGMVSHMCDKVIEQSEVARNFCRELDRIFHQPETDIDLLRQRVQKAAQYFHHEIHLELAIPTQKHLYKLKNAARIKAYLRRVTEIQTSILHFMERLEHVYYGDINLTEGVKFIALQVVEEAEEAEMPVKEPSKKGDSHRLTLDLYKEGKTIDEILKERNLKRITIEGHLAQYVLSGEVQAKELVSQDTLTHLSALLQQYTLKSALKPIKDSVPEQYSYFDIKVVLHHLHRTTQK